MKIAAYCRVSTASGESEGEEEEPIGAVEAEARAVGKKILSLLDGGLKNDGTPIRPGDIAVIFHDVAAVAAALDTIPYEIFTAIGARVTRCDAQRISRHIKLKEE